MVHRHTIFPHKHADDQWSHWLNPEKFNSKKNETAMYFLNQHIKRIMLTDLKSRLLPMSNSCTIHHASGKRHWTLHFSSLILLMCKVANGWQQIALWVMCAISVAAAVRLTFCRKQKSVQYLVQTIRHTITLHIDRTWSWLKNEGQTDTTKLFTCWTVVTQGWDPKQFTWLDSCHTRTWTKDSVYTECT